ncbi:MAG: radical SAM protein, partial [Desulfonatronovibrionaceae bacterium]
MTGPQNKLKGRQPAYVQAHGSGRLDQAVRRFREMSAPCIVCPRKCRVNRLNNETGYCGIGRRAGVASSSLHFGEEKPLRSRGGSGTVFFAGCNLGCVFCQNQDISAKPADWPALDPQDLACIFLELQSAGAENINLVTPSHVILPILEALSTAAEKGLRIPLVYNTGSYDRLSTLALLEGIVDIYLADAKFFHTQHAQRFAAAADYPETARKAIQEMNRQAGPLVLDSRGIAIKGLMIRHLVMPGNLAGSDQWLDFFAAELPADTYINIMGQYHPAGQA